MLPQVDELATVVVCEDDEPTRELLCDHLTADRYRALPAPSASDALRLCGYNSPDLMVLDLVLPDAAGIDVLRQIRSAEGASDRFDPQLPVIVLSGRGAEEDRVRGFSAGADGRCCAAAPPAARGRSGSGSCWWIRSRAG
jgi:DNA-binding response OmpR family regulator